MASDTVMAMEIIVQLLSSPVSIITQCHRLYSFWYIGTHFILIQIKCILWRSTDFKAFGQSAADHKDWCVVAWLIQLDAMPNSLSVRYHLTNCIYTNTYSDPVPFAFCPLSSMKSCANKGSSTSRDNNTPASFKECYFNVISYSQLFLLRLNTIHDTTRTQIIINEQPGLQLCRY